MIQIIVQAQKASCRKSSGERITTGMIGKTVSFDFSAEWDGLVKTAVFEGSGVKKDVTLSGDSAVIPHECLTVPGGMLRVGVFGTDGTTQTPTVYTDIGQIEQGADPSGDTSADPTLPIWAQLQAMMGSLDNLTTTAKENLVAAINEAAKSGGGGAAADVRMQVAGGYIQYSSDGGKSWVNLIALSELIGAPGKTAYDYAVEAGYTGTEDEFSARMAEDIPAVDSTLTKSGQAADAAVVGNRLSALSEEMLTEESDPTVPSWAKAAQKPSYTASEVGADPSGTAAAQVAAHNSGTDTHSDIRVLIQGLTDRLNALADSDDTTLDQLSEVVAYIKSNRDLISSITTDKVGVADIVNDLVTNVANKPLSAAQGVALKALIDALTEAMPEAYSLPIASSTVLGGVKPVAKTEAMAQSVGVDEAGALWTAPGSAGSAVSTLKKVWSVDVTETIADLHQIINFAGPVRRIVIIGKALEGSTSSESRAGITFKQSGLADAETLNIKGVVGASGTPTYFSAVFDVFAGGYVCEFLTNKGSGFHTWNHLVTTHYYYVNPDRMAKWDAIGFNVWNVSSGSIEIWADAEVLE